MKGNKFTPAFRADGRAHLRFKDEKRRQGNRQIEKKRETHLFNSNFTAVSINCDPESRDLVQRWFVYNGTVSLRETKVYLIPNGDTDFILIF